MIRTKAHFILQQLGRNRTSILAWSIIWTLLGMLFATVFKTLSASAEQSVRIYESLPPAVLKTVNISTDYLTKPENFLSGQFLTIYLLAGSIFAVIMGVSAIGGKIQNKTIMNYLTKRLSRPAIVLLLAFVISVTLVVMNIVVALTLFGSFSLLSGSSIAAQYIIATFTGSAIIFIAFAAIGMVAGIRLDKQPATAAGSALAVVSFFVNGLGSLAGAPSWVQNCSLYYYFNPAHLREFYALDTRIFVPVALATVLICGGAYLFNKKDLYL